MKVGIYPMTNGEKNFLKFFDAKEAIYEGDGRLREEISDYNETIIYFFEDAVVNHETTEVGDHYVGFRDVFQIDNRFFAVEYAGVGKDLDEYVNFSYPVEVKPVIVSKTVYEEV